MMTKIIKESKSFKKGYSFAYTFVKIGGKTFRLKYECGNNYLYREAKVLLDDGTWGFVAYFSETGHKDGFTSWYGSDPSEHKQCNDEFVSAMIDHLKLLQS